MRSLSRSRDEPPYCGVAEPGGTVLTSDPDDLEALAAHAADVLIERI
jgi:hypothetical protein